MVSDSEYIIYLFFYINGNSEAVLQRKLPLMVVAVIVQKKVKDDHTDVKARFSSSRSFSYLPDEIFTPYPLTHETNRIPKTQFWFCLHD